MGNCYLPYSIAVRDQIRLTDFKQFLGSNWPIFALLNTPSWHFPGFDREVMDFDCVNKDRQSGMFDWTGFLDTFQWPYNVDLLPYERSVEEMNTKNSEEARREGREPDGLAQAFFPEDIKLYEKQIREEKDRYPHLGLNAEQDNAIILEEEDMMKAGNPSVEEIAKEEEDVPLTSIAKQYADHGRFIYYPMASESVDKAKSSKKDHINPEKTRAGNGAQQWYNSTPFLRPSHAHYYSEQRSWWLDSIKHVYLEEMNSKMSTASKECLYGLYTAGIIKALWAADTESSAFQSYSESLSSMFYESLHFLGGSKWPIFALLEHSRSLRRHEYLIDFTESELKKIPYRHSGPWLQSLEKERHRKILGILTPDVDKNKGWHKSLLKRIWIDGETKPKLEYPVLSSSSSSGYRLEFQETVRTIVQAGLEKRFLYVTFVYGKYKQYLKGWIRRLAYLGIRNMLFYSLDQDSYEECLKWTSYYIKDTDSSESEHRDQVQCLRGSTISALSKFTICLVALQLGFDVMWLDMDIFLLKDPTNRILELSRGKDWNDQDTTKLKLEEVEDKEKDFFRRDWHDRASMISAPLYGDEFSYLTASGEEEYAEKIELEDKLVESGDIPDDDTINLIDSKSKTAPPFEFLISYSFSSDCICNGFFYLKSTKTVVNWMFHLIAWLYQHPYEHDQRAMSAFLNYTEKVSLPKNGTVGYDTPKIPHWFVFDTDNAFVNWPEWTGNFEKIYILHFLDGAAYSLYGRGEWDPSIPYERSQFGRRNETDEQPEEIDPSRSLMDVFYQNPAVEKNNKDQLTKPLKKMIMDSRSDDVVERQHCGILPNVGSAYEGKGWVDNLIKENGYVW